MKIAQWLDGKKVYIGWTAVIVYGLGIQFGLFPANEMVRLAIAAWTGVSYRLAISKI